jgi:hypothetical protein
MFKIVKLIIVILALYIGISCAIPWIKFYIFKSSSFKVINISTSITNKEIIDMLKEKAEELNIKLDKDSISIEEFDNGNKFIVKYKSIVSFPYVENKIIFDHEFSRFRKKRE